MKDSERIEIAKKAILKIRMVKKERKNISEEIKAHQSAMEMEVTADPQTAKMDSVRNHLKIIKGLKSHRKDHGETIKTFRTACEDIILGNGTYDPSQLDFSDLPTSEK